MSLTKPAATYGNSETINYFVDIVAPGSSGAWELNLPPRLRDYQSEIEALLGRVFSGMPRSTDNLELAQQMTLNWCISKCRKIGINWDESFVAERA